MPQLDEYLTGTEKEKKPYTWRELKRFCCALNDDQLDEEVTLSQDESPVITVQGADTAEHDYYVNKTDAEDVGALDDLKALHGDEFNEENYEIATPINTPFLF